MNVDQIPEDLIAACIIDHNNKKFYGVSKLFVLNQMKNETTKIESSFDNNYGYSRNLATNF